jgi:site-specific DNA-cytosine methylase
LTAKGPAGSRKLLEQARVTTMAGDAPTVMSGFAGFHGNVAASSEVVPTLASASAGSLIVGGAGNKQAHGFNHHRSGYGGAVMPSLTVGSPGGADCAPGNAMGFTRASSVDAFDDGQPTLTAEAWAMASLSGDVRKLTPVECEILQGFEPGYTAVPTKRRNKAMEDPEMMAYQKRVLAHLNYTDAQLMTLFPDGARYKALGNSWAVPCARWVGERIQLVDDILRASDLGLL